MDELSTKAVIIGVSIFVTITILTVVLLEFTQISDIYEHVGETNITFEERLDEFDKYRDKNNVFSGIDVLNTLSKYKNNALVDVCVNEASLKCNDEVTIGEEYYGNKFNATLIENGNKYIIKFF